MLPFNEKLKRLNPTIIFIIGITFLLFFISAYSTKFFYLLHFKSSKEYIYYAVVSLFCIIIYLYYFTHFIEKKKIVLWKERNYKFYFYIVAPIILFLIAASIGIALNFILTKYFGYVHDYANGKEQIAFKQQNVILYTFFIACVVISEELIYNGYILPRLHLILNNTNASILCTSLLFSLSHFAGHNPVQLIGTFFKGLISACFYTRYRSLIILIIAHFMIDIISI